MNRDNLIDSIGKIDDDMVQKLEVLRMEKKKKSSWLKWSAMADCLCLVVAGAYLTHNPSAPNDDAQKPVIEQGGTIENKLENETNLPTDPATDESKNQNPSDVEDQPADEDGTYHENPTGNLPPVMENIFCGSYTDSKGQFVVVLIEDTPQNRSTVCKELGIKEDQVSFQTGTYTLQYLTELQRKISEGMVQKELPFVVASSVNEISNRITISVTTDDETLLKKVLSLDTIGGAIEIQVSEGAIQEDIAVLE